MKTRIIKRPAKIKELQIDATGKEKEVMVKFTALVHINNAIPPTHKEFQSYE